MECRRAGRQGPEGDLWPDLKTFFTALQRRYANTRNADPVKSYVATLFVKGDDAIIRKVGEEATETVMAAEGW